jgi:predicted nuclease of predicted toxin-antitoxin system
MLQRRLQKLWLISTDSIRNRDLEELIRNNLSQVVTLFQQYRFVELSRTDLIAHI